MATQDEITVEEVRDLLIDLGVDYEKFVSVLSRVVEINEDGKDGDTR